MKTCTKCNKNKELNEFRKRKDAPDGLSYWCKSCSSIKRSLWEKDRASRELRRIEKLEKRKNEKQKIKKCSKCKKIKELSDFSERRDSRDGLRGHCRECVTERNFNFHLKNKEERNAESKDYYYENREDRLKKQKVLNLKHRLEKPSYHKDYYDKNREEILAKKSTYIQANLPKIIAKNMKRHATKKQRTPKWLAKPHFKEIEAFYIEASRITKETGIKHHVDHIIPLQGENVSGLHVPWNLQILTASENISKGNRIIL